MGWTFFFLVGGLESVLLCDGRWSCLGVWILVIAWCYCISCMEMYG